MEERMVRVRMMVLGALMIVCAYVWVLPYLGEASATGVARSDEFTVTFLNVGQGDAIRIETPDGVQALIDGGRDGTVLRELARELGAFDRTIDLVVATHPDMDHIGGLVDVLDRYEVATILRTENESDTATSRAFTERAEAEGARIVMARAGQEFQLGARVTLRVLFPASDPTRMESNASSIVVQVSYGEFDVLLTGDAPSRIEEYLVTTYGDTLQSEVLKLGHHGSNTSSAPFFLGAVAPQYGIVSAGTDNDYGHPHAEVLDTAAEYGIVVLETKNGTVMITSDGDAFQVE